MTGEPPEFCSQLSRAMGEPIHGTASEAGAWLALEYSAGWPRQVLPGAELLPAAVRERLRTALRSGERNRFVLVKQSGRRVPEDGAGARLFVAVTDSPSPVVRGLTLGGWADLLQLPLERMLRGDFRAVPQAEPLPELYLVCTHGKHDKCCAKFGLPVYDALTALAPAATWQTSHVGGDRFAANLVCLPSGVYYGRVTPDDVAALLAWSRAGQIQLDRYRGRSSVDMLVSAADYLLRRETGELGLGAYDYLGLEPLDDFTERSRSRWRVRFYDRINQRPLVVELERETETRASWLTCEHNHDHIPSYQRLANGA